MKPWKEPRARATEEASGGAGGEGNQRNHVIVIFLERRGSGYCRLSWERGIDCPPDPERSVMWVECVWPFDTKGKGAKRANASTHPTLL